jgi:hypothetical protein
MGAFKDSKHAADVIGGFFKKMASERWQEGQLGGSGLILAYSLKNPDVRIVLDARAKPEPGKGFAVFVDDPNAPQPVTEFTLEADDFDRLYKGELEALSMLSKGTLKADGDVGLAMRLLPAQLRSIPFYKSYRETH